MVIFNPPNKHLDCGLKIKLSRKKISERFSEISWNLYKKSHLKP